MKKRHQLMSLLVGAVILPMQSYAAESLNAESYVPGITHNDGAPVTGRLGKVAGKTTPIKPQGLATSRLQSLRTLRAAAVTTQAATAATVAPPVAGCADIQVGAAYNANTAPSGQTDCFEFVAADLTKTVAYVVNLPANEQHDVHLVQVNNDGTLTYLDNETGTAQSKVVEGIPPGPVRLLLLVDSQQGTGGATFQFQVTGTTGYDSYEPNDSINRPSQLTGNQLISANLDTVSDVDYYTVQVPSTQSANLITFTGTGTQTAQLLTAPNTWATLASGTTYNVSSSAGATLMLRVYNTGTSAPASQPYTLRVSDGAGTAGFYRFLDSENITHLAPSHENVARTVTPGVIAWDHTGNVRLPAGEHVTIQAYDRSTTNQLTLLTTTSGYTGADGSLSLPLNVGTCQGSGTFTGDFQTLSTPADHWRITYNPNSFAVAYTDSGALSASSSYSYFTHICTETYLGRY
ncbi:hypothetical protein F3J16_09195 [Burkholderia sp. Ap-962]|uniref:hypothetical protein n=1 Tax=Burkholderia sp. Ap-962 TaxID=2608333 RepID=UPI0014249CD0|nr:hypothetical protein [Burkholderia sp. Ap-962]NIF70358.1 hypothetical protein [Burkholderia sp. Ap-962]